MNANFKQSATGAPSAQNQLVFVSDFQGTLEGNGVNIPLFKLLNDVHAAGHRVIFTSTSALDPFIDFLSLIPKFGARKGINLNNIAKIINEEKNGARTNVLPKYQLHELTDVAGQPLKFDYVFDDQPVSYVTPKNEIRVTAPFVNGGAFKTAPLTLDQIRLTFLGDYLRNTAPERHP